MRFLVPALALLTAGLVQAHCDSVDGPVVAAARQALESGDITPVLKWVRKQDEPPVRGAFALALKVRRGGAESRQLADTWFFETLVRLHRAGEGAPYTGLKPAGDVEPAITRADAALETGSVDGLVRGLIAEVADGLRERYTRARQAREKAGTTVEAGRDYVASYVELMHYVERVNALTAAHAHTH
ncbi:MAG: DUF6448 family protein [Bryobacteraceae bacterium]